MIEGQMAKYEVATFCYIEADSEREAAKKMYAIINSRPEGWPEQYVTTVKREADRTHLTADQIKSNTVWKPNSGEDWCVIVDRVESNDAGDWIYYHNHARPNVQYDKDIFSFQVRYHPDDTQKPKIFQELDQIFSKVPEAPASFPINDFIEDEDDS
jgi:hypothetical protein